MRTPERLQIYFNTFNMLALDMDLLAGSVTPRPGSESHHHKYYGIHIAYGVK